MGVLGELQCQWAGVGDGGLVLIVSHQTAGMAHVLYTIHHTGQLSTPLPPGPVYGTIGFCLCQVIPPQGKCGMARNYGGPS